MTYNPKNKIKKSNIYIIGTKAYKIGFLMDFSGRTMYQFRNLYNVFSNSLLDTF